jgi:hypothetical protein
MVRESYEGKPDAASILYPGIRLNVRKWTSEDAPTQAGLYRPTIGHEVHGSVVNQSLTIVAVGLDTPVGFLRDALCDSIHGSLCEKLIATFCELRYPV